MKCALICANSLCSAMSTIEAVALPVLGYRSEDDRGGESGSGRVKMVVAALARASRRCRWGHERAQVGDGGLSIAAWATENTTLEVEA